MKRRIAILATLGGAFILIGALLHHLVPEPILAAHHHNVAGDVLVNQTAGERVYFRQVDGKSEHGETILDVRLNTGGRIPVSHVHPQTSETFSVRSGQLKLVVDGKTHILKPGQSFTVAKGRAHAASNPFDKPAEVEVKMRPSHQMNLALTQVHGFLHEAGDGLGPKNFLQMLRFAERYEVYLGTTPIWLQRLGIFMLAPTARMLGFKSFYPRYAESARQRNKAKRRP